MKWLHKFIFGGVFFSFHLLAFSQVTLQKQLDPETQKLYPLKSWTDVYKMDLFLNWFWSMHQNFAMNGGRVIDFDIAQDTALLTLNGKYYYVAAVNKPRS